MQLTETHKLRITQKQKQTLVILAEKYNINVSQFIRDAIAEKLQRDKINIKEIKIMVKKDCPF